MDSTKAAPQTVHEAASLNDIDKLKALLKFNSDANERDEYGQTPLHYAVHHGSYESVLFLLTKKAEVNIQDIKGQSPLHMAAYQRRFDCVKLLIDHDASVHLQDASSYTPLHYAALFGNGEMAKAILSENPSIDIQSEGGSTPLHLAATAGNYECVQDLLQRGALINITDFQGASPLHLAASKDSSKCTEILLSFGADPTILDIDDSTILHNAAEGGSPESIALIYKTGKIDIASRNAQGYSPLHIAAERGHKGAVEKLIALGAPVDLGDLMGNTPLHLASHEGHLGCVELLVGSTKNKSVNQINVVGSTALHSAAYQGHKDVVEFLMKNKAKAKIPDVEGAVPLHKAAFNGHDECIQLLLKKRKSMLNVGDNSGATALHKAAYNGHEKCVQFLISKGADIFVQDADGGTPLHNAVIHPSGVPCVQALLTACQAANSPLSDFVNAVDSNQRTPLHFASWLGSTDTVSLLLQNGGNKDALDVSNQTPLFLAVSGGAETNCKLLINSNADHKIKDSKGRSVVDLSDYFPNNKLIVPSSIITQMVYERDHPVADRLDPAKLNEHQRQILMSGVGLFNGLPLPGSDTPGKPLKGIEYLIQQHLLKPTSDSIAYFLFTNRKLDQTLLGDFISERDDQINDKLSACGCLFDIAELRNDYVKYFDFEDLEFDMALRRFLSRFKLPGESQKIERCMEIFAQHFWNMNLHSIFPSKDAVFFLAFSTIMLNTDQHSPMVIKKMTKDQFIERIRLDRESGCDKLPAEFLEDLYNKVKTNMVRIGATTPIPTLSAQPSSSKSKGNFIGNARSQPSAPPTHLLSIDEVPWGNADKEGWMEKLGGRHKVWRKRWMVLKDSCLYYFRKPMETGMSGKTKLWVPMGMFPLEDLKATIDIKRSSKRKWCIVMTNKDSTKKLKSCVFKSTSGGGKTTKEGKHDYLCMSAPSKKEMNAWFYRIIKNMGTSAWERDKELAPASPRKRNELENTTEPTSNTKTTNVTNNNSSSSVGGPSKASNSSFSPANNSKATVPSFGSSTPSPNNSKATVPSFAGGSGFTTGSLSLDKAERSKGRSFEIGSRSARLSGPVEEPKPSGTVPSRGPPPIVPRRVYPPSEKPVFAPAGSVGRKPQSFSGELGKPSNNGVTRVRLVQHSSSANTSPTPLSPLVPDSAKKRENILKG